MRNLRFNIERGPSALDGVKSLCKSFLLLVLSGVIEVQELIWDATQAFVDSGKLSASMKERDLVFPAAQEIW